MRISLVFPSVLLLAGCHATAPVPSADRVMLAGDIRTMDAAQTSATALALRDGRIVYVGDDLRVRAFIGKGTQVDILHGETVLPGLIDTHIHVMDGALSLQGCNLHGATLDLDELGQRVRECAALQTGEDWLLVNEFSGANQVLGRAELDAVIGGRPLLLWGLDGHTAWTNSAGLARAGIHRGTPDPVNGRFERDAAGEATGFLVDAAVEQVMAVMPQPTPAQRIDALRQTLPLLHADGITAWQEANASADIVAAYAGLAAAGPLAAHVSLALGSEGRADEAEFSRLQSLRAQAQAAGLQADTVKLFADGVVEYPTQTAAMLAPYLGADGRPTQNTGQLYVDPDSMREFVQRAAGHGFGVHVHAIGDRAVRTSLDAFEAARAAGSTQRYSLAHVQFVDPADKPRFQALDVTASLQLYWALPDSYSVDASAPYLGPERQALMYPARSLKDQGARIAGGSDWNVSTFNPFAAMAVAVSRANPDEPERGTLNPGEALSLPDMLQAYTLDAARMLGREHEIGSLEVGKAADLIVLDRTLRDTDTAETIAAARVRLTVIGGRSVYVRAADD